MDSESLDQGKQEDENLGLRPVFFGNLVPNFSVDDLRAVFEKPVQPKPDTPYEPIPVDRVDQKRGYCFIFLKDATSQADKERVQKFVSDLNGM